MSDRAFPVVGKVFSLGLPFDRKGGVLSLTEERRLVRALVEIRTMLNSDYPEWRIADAALRGEE